MNSRSVMFFIFKSNETNVFYGLKRTRIGIRKTRESSYPKFETGQRLIVVDLVVMADEYCVCSSVSYVRWSRVCVSVTC